MQNYLMKIIIMLLLGATLWAQSPLTLHFFTASMTMEYKEYDTDGVLLDSEDATFGDIGGIDAGIGYTYAHANGFYSNLELDYQKVSGLSIYKGSVLGSGDPYGSVVSTTQNRLKDIHFMFKELYALNTLVTLKAGVGYGHHTWERELSVIQLETYSWNYLRFIIGSAFKLDSTSKWSFDLYVAYEYALSPQMSTDINGTGLKFDLGGVVCYEAALYGAYDIGRGFLLVGGYLFKRQDIDASNKLSIGTNSYYEPRSVDYQHFYKFGLQYRF